MRAFIAAQNQPMNTGRRFITRMPWAPLAGAPLLAAACQP